MYLDASLLYLAPLKKSDFWSYPNQVQNFAVFAVQDWCKFKAFAKHNGYCGILFICFLYLGLLCDPMAAQYLHFRFSPQYSMLFRYRDRLTLTKSVNYYQELKLRPDLYFRAVILPSSVLWFLLCMHTKYFSASLAWQKVPLADK